MTAGTLRILRRPTVLVGSITLTILLVAALLAPWLTAHGPNQLNIRNRLVSPSIAHPMGTDDLGRDVLTRTIYGTRLSLVVGITTALLATVAGTVIALVAGYYRWLDEVVMRILDGLMALPGILLAIAIMAAVGPRVENIIAALALVYMPRCARVARASILVVREHVYVEAARALGARDRALMFMHILPGTISPLLVQGTYVFATAILLESSLTFLGAGAPADVPSWGAMLSEGRLHMRTASWMTIFPGVALALTVLSVNLIGDGLRDALDPRMRRN